MIHINNIKKNWPVNELLDSTNFCSRFEKKLLNNIESIISLNKINSLRKKDAFSIQIVSRNILIIFNYYRGNKQLDKWLWLVYTITI